MDLNQQLVARLASLCKATETVVATAESCTGGLVSTCITEMPGSSAWFDRGFVTYSNQAKIDLLGVAEQVLQQHGAVSETTAKQMAEGAVRHSLAHLSVSITGVAGPDGGTDSKPVGMVCFAVGEKCTDGSITSTANTQYFKGDRHSIRLQATHHALGLLVQALLK